jgi:hypothetical protein
VPSLPIAHGVLEGTLGPGLGTLKRVANILRLFSRELPPIRPKLVTCAGMKGSSPSCQPLYVRRTRLLMPRGNPLSVGTGGGAAPRICRGRRPGPVSSGCHRVPGQSRRARCTARFNFLLSAARALEPQCRLTLCRRNARPILHVVAVVHPRGETGRRSLRVIATPRSDCRFPLSSHGVQREDDQKQAAQGPPKHLRCITFLHGLIITTELNKRSLMSF